MTNKVCEWCDTAFEATWNAQIKSLCKKSIQCTKLQSGEKFKLSMVQQTIYFFKAQILLQL